MKRLLFLFISVLFYSSTMAQNFKQIKEDTLFLDFQGQFNYDVVFVYVNGVKVFENILYTRSSMGYSYKSLDVKYNSMDSLVVKVVVFERNHQFSLEYNALWYEWVAKTDTEVYLQPKEYIKVIYPKNDGKYVGIGYNGKSPVIESSRNKFFYD